MEAALWAFQAVSRMLIRKLVKLENLRTWDAVPGPSSEPDHLPSPSSVLDHLPGTAVPGWELDKLLNGFAQRITQGIQPEMIEPY